MRGLQFLQGLRLPPPNSNYNRRGNETPGQLMAMNDRLDIVLLTSNNQLWHSNLRDLRNIDPDTEEGGKWSLCSGYGVPGDLVLCLSECNYYDYD